MKLAETIKGIKKEYKIEFIFLLAVFGYYFLWAYIQPFNVSPDEAMRYDVAKYIYNHGGVLPHGGDPEIRNEIWGISYAFSPIAAYMLGAYLMKIVSFVNANPFALLMAARLVSMFFGVGTVFFTIRIAKRVFQNKRIAWLLILAVAFFPNLAFLSSYVNNDTMALFSTAFITYVWIRVMQEGSWNWKNCILLGVAVSVCAMSYYNAYGYALCSIILFIIVFMIGKNKKECFKKMMVRGLAITGIFLALCGWWFVRNAVIYDGDFLGRRTMTEYAEKYAEEGYKPSDHITPQKEGQGVWEMVTGYGPHPYKWYGMVMRSFVGMYGHMNHLQPYGYYLIWWTFLLAGLAGSILIHPGRLFAVRKNKTWQLSGIVHWTMIAAMIIPNLLNIYYSYASDYQPQGRYSMPMFIPMMYFVVMGWQNIGKLFLKKERRVNVLIFHFCMLVVALGVYSYYSVFLPLYRPDLANMANWF